MFLRHIMDAKVVIEDTNKVGVCMLTSRTKNRPGILDQFGLVPSSGSWRTIAFGSVPNSRIG